MKKFIEKITLFITRTRSDRLELLLIQHPKAGIQIPAGTVRIGETVEQAVKRETLEETKLTDFSMKYIGYSESSLPADQRIIMEKTKVFAHPDINSYSWAEIRKKVQVKLERSTNDFSQVTYFEENRFPNPDYISYQITGWIPSRILCRKKKRHFFHLTVTKETLDEWEVLAEPELNYTYRVFWAYFDTLPPIIPPQYEWLEYVKSELNYIF
ncbi:MAG: NUDIX domain-containing protein [Candidatus Hodarchaeota archaeon]